MAQVIRNAKDGLDETTEKVRAIRTMVEGYPASAAKANALAALTEATASLSLAREAVARMDAGRRGSSRAVA